MSGIDSLLAIMIVTVGGLILFWSIRALTMQFTVGQFVFFGVFCVLIGMFIESWLAGTGELVLTTVAILVLMAVYVLMKSRILAMGRKKVRS